MPIVFNAVEAERDELTWLLSSGVLGRSNNLARMLKFICEKHFEGREDQIKESSIAIEALGRRSDFDPQVDTIVRVTTHSLRKRLQEVYQGEGANRPIHILIPAGHYVPSFVHRDTSEKRYADSATQNIVPSEPFESVSQSGDAGPQAESTGKRRPWWFWGLAVCITLAAAVASFFLAKRAVHPVEGAAKSAASTTALSGDVRALVGTERQSYVDRSGKIWTPGPWCKGGTGFTVPDQKIAGTEDPYLYLGGIRGISHCLFPVKPGLYEVHLLFAETSDQQDATRSVVLSLNGGDAINLDVVDEAAGNGIATTRVFKAVLPQSDGSIHLDFISEDSMLNAVEILPTPTGEINPIRIVTSPHPYTDSANRLWLSDRYFIGGRRGQLSDPGRIVDAGLYDSDRIGHFHYILPAVPFEKYRVKLFFTEPWFGKQNGGSGGVGSRVFDVSSNGAVLLKNFDISKEGGGSKPVIKTFDNIQATAQGKIELYFTPVVNYPLLNAIEVTPEPSH